MGTRCRASVIYMFMCLTDNAKYMLKGLIDNVIYMFICLTDNVIYMLKCLTDNVIYMFICNRCTT